MRHISIVCCLALAAIAQSCSSAHPSPPAPAPSPGVAPAATGWPAGVRMRWEEVRLAGREARLPPQGPADFARAVDDSVPSGTIRVTGLITAPYSCFRLGSALDARTPGALDLEIALVPPRPPDVACAARVGRFAYDAELGPLAPGTYSLRVRHHWVHWRVGEDADTTMLTTRVVVH